MTRRHMGARCRPLFLALTTLTVFIRASARRSACVVLVAGLAGCAFRDLQPRSELASAAALQAAESLRATPVSEAAWPREDWWTAFGDPQLDRLVAEALADSPTLRMAAARVRMAESVQSLAEARHDPRADVAASNVRERFSADGTTPHPVAGTWKTVNQGTLSVGYELDFWGRNEAAVGAALDRVHASEVDLYAVRLMLSSAVVQAYLGLDETSRQLDILRQLLTRQEQVLDLTHRRFSAELDSQIDIRQAEAALPASRAAIAGLQASLELARNQLAALLGKGPDRGRLIERPHLTLQASAAIPSTLTAELIGRRPDVVAQRWLVEAASRDIKVAQAEFYPNINLTAFIGLQSLGFQHFAEGQSRILGAGPALSLPIFDGGRRRANLAAQDAARDVAVEAYNQTLVNAVKDIADQVASLRWLGEELTQQRQAVGTASAAAALAKLRYEAGVGTYIQVLTTQNAELTQQRLLSRLDSQAWSLQANLSRALGGGYLPERDAGADAAGQSKQEASFR